MSGSEIENGSSPTPPSQTAADVRRSYGVMNPISFAGPTEADTHRNSLLEKFLMDSGIYESEEETAKREEVLRRLDEPPLPGKPPLPKYRFKSSREISIENNLKVKNKCGKCGEAAHNIRACKIYGEEKQALLNKLTAEKIEPAKKRECPEKKESAKKKQFVDNNMLQ